MGRRVSNGTVGAGPTFGSLVAQTNTLSTAGSNTPLIIDPAGTGVTQFVGNIQLNGNGATGGELRLGDADVSSSAANYYLALRAPSTVASNKTFTLPDSLGTNGYVLSTDGSGVLSWVTQTTAGVSLNDASSTAGTFYLLLNNSAGTGSNITALYTQANITYSPSSNTLTTSVMRSPSLQGSTSAASSGTASLTIVGTVSATKNTGNQGSVYFSESVTSSSTTTGTVVINGGCGVVGTINAGNITTAGTITAGTVTETSSILFKENLNPIVDALDKILQLNAFTYDRKDGSRQGEAGLIAEQVFNILPNLVSKNSEGQVEGIFYTKLTAYLVESIKTLKAEIDQLKASR